jgi:probable HAF family extracellular repeat protein
MKSQSIFLWAIIACSIFFADLCFALTPRYTIIDLGTIYGQYSIAHAINNDGVIVGESDRCAFIWDSNKGMIDLGTLEDNRETSAWGINETGKVIGYSRSQIGWKSFLWHNGKITDLGSLGGHTKAYDINNSGIVVGRSVTSPNQYHAFIWQPSMPIHDLGVIGNGMDSRAYAINEKGQVAGASKDANGHSRAFLWDKKTGMLDLGKLDGDNESLAYAINNKRQIVGASYNTKGICRAFIWDAENGISNIGSFGNYRDKRAWSTGNAWEVVGKSNVDLAAFGGRHSGAKGINETGDVVGYLYVAESNWHAFIWKKSDGLIDLNDLLPANNEWKCLKEAFDINNQGQIVGYGITKNNQIHAFLMSPVIPTSEEQ